MTYSVNDYNRRDLSSYFNQTDVVVGNQVGNITDTNGDNGLFLPRSSTSSQVVRMLDIQWEGRYPSRILTHVNNSSVFLLAGVVGTRTYKKGITRDNFGYLKVRKPSRITGGIYAELPHRAARNYNVDHVYAAYLSSLSDLYSASEQTMTECVMNTKAMLFDFGKSIAPLGNNAVVYVSSDYLVGVQWDDDANQFIVEHVMIVRDYITSISKLYRKLYKGKDNG